MGKTPLGFEGLGNYLRFPHPLSPKEPPKTPDREPSILQDPLHPLGPPLSFRTLSAFQVLLVLQGPLSIRAHSARMGPLDMRGRKEEERGRPAWGGSHRIRGAGNCPGFCPLGPEEPPGARGQALHPLRPFLPPVNPTLHIQGFSFFSCLFLLLLLLCFLGGFCFVFFFFFLLFSSGVQFYLPGVVKHISLFSLLFL